MTVPIQTPYKAYTGNGSAVQFAYTFLINFAADMVVTINGSITTAYTIDGIGQTGGGNITFTTAPADGSAIILRRNVSVTRQTDYQDNGDLLADTINRDFDRIIMMIQDKSADTDTALKYPVGTAAYDAGGRRITGLGVPTLDSDGVNKGYVDKLFTDTAQAVLDQAKGYRDDAANSASSAATSAQTCANAVSSVAQYAQNAANSASTANAAKADAAESARLAGLSEGRATNASTLADQRASAAAESANDAQDAALEALQSKKDAATSASTANAAKADAVTARTGAQSAQSAAETAQTAAETAQQKAQTLVTNMQNFVDLGGAAQSVNTGTQAVAWKGAHTFVGDGYAATLKAKTSSGNAAMLFAGSDGTAVAQVGLTVDGLVLRTTSGVGFSLNSTRNINVDGQINAADNIVGASGFYVGFDGKGSQASQSASDVFFHTSALPEANTGWRGSINYNSSGFRFLRLRRDGGGVQTITLPAGNGTITVNTSDQTAKDLVGEVDEENAIANIDQLRLVRYKWNSVRYGERDEYNGPKMDKERRGFLAQQANDIEPSYSLEPESEGTLWGIDDRAIMADMVAYIRYLKREVEALKKA